MLELAVEGFLHELAARPAGALTVELARLPGTRETRWAQLLAGPVSADVVAEARHEMGSGDGDPLAASEIATLKHNVASLQEELASLKATVARLCGELGVDAGGATPRS